MSEVVAFGFGDEVADGFVAGDVVARTTARGTRRQSRPGDDDCAGAAVSGCGRKRAQDCGHDVGPEDEQRCELSDQPENTGDDDFDGEAVQIAQDVPPRMVAARVAFDDEELVVLVLHVGRVNTKPIKN